MNQRPAGRAPLSVSGLVPGPAVLLPGAKAGEWELLRQPAPLTPGTPGGLTEQIFSSLESAALHLTPGEPFILEVPLEVGLIQRFVLPLAEPSEIEEMARIQLERILPYPPETVGLAFTEVARGETEVILSVEALHHDRLVMLCAPLVARGCWPMRVLFHARAVAAAIGETAPFVCGESGKLVLGISEAGRLSFAQALSVGAGGDIGVELPAVFLGAELEGLPTNFSEVWLDAHCKEASEALEVSLGLPVQIFDPAVAAVPAAGAMAGDLSPPSWRSERLRLERLVGFKRRVLIAAGVYAGLVVLGLLTLAGLKLRVAWLEGQLTSVRPASAAVQAGDLRWKDLSAAIDPSRYVVETLMQVYECLPPGDTIRLTSFSVSLVSNPPILIQGEAPSPAAAVEFTEKLKDRKELRTFHLKAPPPSISPNGHGSFRVEGGGS